MSLDIEAFCASKSPPMIETVCAHCQPLGLTFIVGSRGRGWSKFTVRSTGPFKDRDTIAFWFADHSHAQQIQKAFEVRNNEEIAECVRQNMVGSMQLCAKSPSAKSKKLQAQVYAFAPNKGNGTLNLYAAEGMAQAFVIELGGHYELDGERCVPENNIVTPLLLIKNVKHSTELGSDEEQDRRMHEYRLAWNEQTDAGLTNLQCPQCQKPMPTYRKKCRYCGFERGRTL